MAQERNVLMGLSVKAMVFHDGKLLILQKNDIEGLHLGNFPAEDCSFMKILKPDYGGKSRKKRACPLS